jgi:hypothetical protein
MVFGIDWMNFVVILDGLGYWFDGVSCCFGIFWEMIGWTLFYFGCFWEFIGWEFVDILDGSGNRLDGVYYCFGIFWELISRSLLRIWLFLIIDLREFVADFDVF